MNTAANWSPAGVPGAGATVDFNGGSTFNSPTISAQAIGGGSGLAGLTVLGTQTSALSINNVNASKIVGLRFAGNAGVTINAGAGAVSFGNSNNPMFINMGTGTSNFINNSANTATLGTNVTLNASGGTSPVVAFGGTGNWVVTGDTSATVTGLVKNGGAVTLSGNNAHVGETIVNTGALTITNSNALGATGAANDTHINGATGNTNLIFSGASLTIAETLNFNANASGRSGFINNNAFNQVLNGPIDVSSTGNLVQWESSSTGSVTINGDITGTMTGGSLLFLRGSSTNVNNRILGSVNIGSATLAKTDDGLWVIGNAGETYAWGSTNVARGTVRLNLANMLPTATVVNVGQGTDTAAATLDLFGFSQTVAGLTKAGNGTNKQITNSSGTAAILTVNNAAANTYNGRINGNLALTKNGVGVLALTDDNAYTGQTLVNDGILRISSNNALGTTAGNTRIVGNSTNDGIVELTGNITTGETFLIDARQGATFNAPALSNLSGNNIVTAQVQGQTGGSQYNIESQAGLLTLQGGFTLVSGATGGRDLKLMGAGNGNVSGAIVNGTGIVRVNKLGTGTWTLSGNNSYTGNTNINQGVLALSGAGAIDGSPVISIATGATFDVSGVSGYNLVSGQSLIGDGSIVGDVITDAGSLISPGFSIGTLSFANNLDINGNILIEVDPAAAGQKIDIINVGGLLDISGANLSFAFLSSPIDGAYVFADYGSLVGDFATISGMPSGYEIKFNYNGQGQIALVSIPEPATMSLLAMGALGLLRRRRMAR